MARLRLASRGSAWRLRGVIALAAIAAAAVSTAPSGGLATQASGRSSQVQAYTLPFPPPPPTASWHAYQVVLGFLHASASYALDPTAAGQYMTPQARKHWQPAVPVTVVGRPPRPASSRRSRCRRTSPSPAEHFEQVKLTGSRLATLSQSGQYQSSPGSAGRTSSRWSRADGIWLIDSAAVDGLLLTQSDFQLVYQPRNLFFFAPPRRSHGCWCPTLSSRRCRF